jgi:outer membrane protein
MFGMIIRNSVILVVQIDQDVGRGLGLWDAIVESTVRRFRPIVLTALAAILAMVPLTRSTFWGPMAWAIMGGLLVATLLTLLFLPALYAACYGAKRAGAPEEAPAAPEAPRKPWKLRLALASSLLALLPSARAVDLVGAYASATGADPTIQAAGEALVAGREKAVQGRAAYLPRVTLSSYATRVRDDSETALPPQLGDLAQEKTSGTLHGTTIQASQPLYRPQSWAEGRQLKAQAGLAEVEYTQARFDLIERVTQAYFGVLLAEEGVRVAEAQKAAFREQLDRAQARFEVGKARATEVEDSRARHDNAQASVISAHSRLDLARAQFQEVTGRTAQGLADFGARFVPAPPQPDSLPPWLDKAVADNSLVRSRRVQVAIAQAEVDKYKLSGRPTVDLVASYGDKGQSGGLSPLVAADRQRTGTLSVQFSVPLFAGGALDSKERESRARQRQAELDLAAAERDVRLQARDAFNAVKSGAARVVALDQSVASARTAVEATIAGRDVGTRTTSDVLDAQERLYAAQRDLAQARYDYLTGRVRLASAAGDLGEEDLRALNTYLR